MSSWKAVLTRLVADAEKHMDELRYRLYYSLGGPGPVKIVPYRGYGTPEKLFLRGRVLEEKRIPEAEKNDKIWENLLYMYRRLESDEVPHARVMARFQDSEQEVVANEEGFFEVTIQPTHPLPENRLFHAVELELLDPIPEEQRLYPVKAVGEVLVPMPGARFIAVSDIDDTVLQANMAHLTKMARNVFLGNAHTRLPFPGVAALYRALFDGASGQEKNPLFYVSSSPWNFYDLLTQFFYLQRIPIGPVLFLRDWGLTEKEILPLHNHDFKIETIRQMIEFYPNLPFILIGDSSQEDPEIYAELVNTYPKRIQAIYIRNVSRNLKRPEAIRELARGVIEAGSALVLADDSLTIAKHAVEQGYISTSALPEISGEKEKDEAPPTVIEKMLGEPAKAEPPTVEVSKSAVKAGDGVIEEKIKEAGREETVKPPTVVVEGDKAKQQKAEQGTPALPIDEKATASKKEGEKKNK